MPQTSLRTVPSRHRARRTSDGVVTVADWDGISHLVAAGETVGRALLGDDTALGRDGDTAPSPAAFLLIEPAEPLMVRHPATGRVDDLQVELLIARGFRRFRPGVAVPPPSPEWTIHSSAAHLGLRDSAGNEWARVRMAGPSPRWLSAAGRDGHVVVLYGAWLGVRTPCGVRDVQYGPAQRAAELRAARMRGHVAVAVVPWRA